MTYRPLSDEELNDEHAETFGIEDESLERMVEQCRRGNALCSAMQALIAQHQNFEWFGQSATARRATEAIRAYLGEAPSEASRANEGSEETPK